MAPVLAHHVRQLLLLLAGFIDAVKAGSFCYYIHEDYYDWRQTYCESGCCRQHGDEDEICCFSWTIGIIMGIAFACVGFIAVIAFLVVCCHQMKKRGRIGSTLQQAVGVHQAPAYPQNNTVVFATAPPYPYPYQQNYPGSGYNAHAPPPYTAVTNPAYPVQAPGRDTGPAAPMYPAFPPSSDPYNGYGTGNG